MIRRLFYLSAGVVLAGCSLAPTYQRPTLTTADHYQEASGTWLSAHPNTDIPIDWWRMFDDPALNQLETLANASNQNIAAAIARLAQARDIARENSAALLPNASAYVSHSNDKITTHKPLFPVQNHPPYQDNQIGLDLNYELDIWGSVRNAVTAANAQALASADNLATIRLSSQAELAMDYFALRGEDQELAIFQRLTQNWQNNLQLTRSMFNIGTANNIDVSQVQLSLQNALTQQADLQLKRTQLEHAIALICGQSPSLFHVPTHTTIMPQIILPRLALPSQLLERRPDIASAERQVAAANANIGVARAAFFPVFSLNAAAGFENTGAANWLTAPNRFWSLGPSAAVILFDGGLLDALSDQARAAWQESVANYRNTVITAWREVEDNLSALHQLDDEQHSTQLAADAAHLLLAQTRSRYQGGIANNLEQLASERGMVDADLTATDVRIRRITTDILLIKALGGGWQNEATAFSQVDKTYYP